MKYDYIASITESLFYNGNVLTNDKKLDIDDFTQMARAAGGDVMRMMWYEERQVGNPMLFFADSIKTIRVKIVKSGRYRVADLPEGGAAKLPNGMGIMLISPAMEKDGCEGEYDFADVYHRGEPGMESSYGSPEMLDDIGEAFYIPIGNRPRLFGYDEATHADVDYIPNDENIDVPEAVAWRIINQVMGTVLKVVGFPVDPTENNNPNVQTIKNALAQQQAL